MYRTSSGRQNAAVNVCGASRFETFGMQDRRMPVFDRCFINWIKLRNLLDTNFLLLEAKLYVHRMSFEMQNGRSRTSPDDVSRSSISRSSLLYVRACRYERRRGQTNLPSDSEPLPSYGTRIYARTLYTVYIRVSHSVGQRASERASRAARLFRQNSAIIAD